MCSKDRLISSVGYVSGSVPEEENVRIPFLLLVVLVAAPAWSEVLVTVDGDRIETKGPWEAKGRRILFTDARGTLRSMSASAIDLEASEQASKPPEPERPAAEAVQSVEVSPALLARADRRENARVLEVESGGRSSAFASEAQVQRLLQQVPEDELPKVAYDVLGLTLRIVDLDREYDLLSRSGIRVGAHRMSIWLPEVRGMQQRAESAAAQEIYRITAREIQALADLAQSDPDAAIAEMRESILELRREFG